MASSPVEPSDETMDIANTLIADMRVPETGDPYKPCPES